MHEPGGMIAVRTPVTDLAAAFFLVIGVLDAAQKRATGARGLIAREVSMAGAGLASLAAWAPTVFAGRDEALAATPGYGVYRAQDGAPMALGALDPWQQTILRRMTGADGDGTSLSDERVATLVASKPSADWLEIANRDGLAITRLLTPKNVIDDTDVREHLLGHLDSKDPWRALLFPVGNGRAGQDRLSDSDAAVQQLLFSSFADNQPKQEVR
jgi:crotonobetainyl-CoA:carnitine CoA-transferase CaiB-like acyl-CoA transferase